MTRLTDADLDAIEARYTKATEGPWDAYVGFDDQGTPYCAVEVEDTEVPVARFHGGFYDADFIAQARTDVPALLAEVRALRAAATKPMTEVPCDCETCRQEAEW